MTVGQQLAQYLLDIQAIKLRPDQPFTWASGLHSPIYCDNRLSLSYPQIRNFIKTELSKIANQFGAFDGIAGVATAGIAHGALVADELDKPFIYVRSKAKGHGRENLIEGDVRNIKKVVVVEDLISTGGSSLQAVQALQDEGIEVVGVIAIFTYGFDIASQAFEEASCPFLTLSNYETLLNQALVSSFIDDRQKEILLAWNQDPKAWSAHYLKAE